MIKSVFYLILLLAGIPTGLLLLKICKDEIKNWYSRLLSILIVSLIVSLIMLFIDFKYKTQIIVALLFIAIVNLTIIWKKAHLNNINS